MGNCRTDELAKAGTLLRESSSIELDMPLSSLSWLLCGNSFGTPSYHCVMDRHTERMRLPFIVTLWETDELAKAGEFLPKSSSIELGMPLASLSRLLCGNSFGTPAYHCVVNRYT